MNITRLTIVLALFAIGLTACSKDEGPEPFPAGTATLLSLIHISEPTRRP